MESVEVRDVAPGLWLWRRPHPDWSPSAAWEPPVTSTCVESRGELLVLDALAPPEDAREVWERLDANPPTVAVVLKPDHVRDVDLFVRRYGCRAFVLPALRKMLELPFEHVIVSHGEPVHERGEFEAALSRPPYAE